MLPNSDYTLSELPPTMRAMVLHQQAPIDSKPLKLETIQIPKPAPDELLLRVEVCALCRTDLHVIEGELPSPALPLVPGHQIVGRVVARGGNCKRYALGDRVGVAWLRSTCQSCEYCRAGAENLCASSRYTGYHAHGGYAEFAVINENYAYGLPLTSAPQDIAPLLCAGIIGFRALKRSRLQPGQSLAIFGFGSSAHLCIQVAKYWGCPVYVYTRSELQQQLAKKLGADWVGGIHSQGPPANSAIVFAPSGEITPLALQAVAPSGTVALAGIFMSDTPSLNYEKSLFHEKTLTSVEANTRLDGEEFLALAAKIPLHSSVRLTSLESLNESLFDLKHDGNAGTLVMSLTSDM